jgi:hypothetical protein
MIIIVVFAVVLSTRAVAKIVFKSLMACKPLVRVRQRPATSASRASRRLAGRFAA